MGWPYLHKPPLGWPLDYDTGLVPEVGFWPMLGSSGNPKILDLSGNENTGTLVADTHWVPGKFGSALDVDGTGDCVDCGIIDVTSFTQMSIVVWFKMDVIESYQMLFTIQYAGNDDFRVGGDATYLYIKFDDGTFPNVQIAFSDTSSWHQIVGVHDGTNTLLYLDGVLKISLADTVDFANAGGQTYIGQRVGAVYNVNGQIDNVSVYNRGLSASEAALLYRSPFCMFKDPAEMILAAGGQTAPATVVPQLQLLRQMWAA